MKLVLLQQQYPLGYWLKRMSREKKTLRIFSLNKLSYYLFIILAIFFSLQILEYPLHTRKLCVDDLSVLQKYSS